MCVTFRNVSLRWLSVLLVVSLTACGSEDPSQNQEPGQSGGGSSNGGDSTGGSSSGGDSTGGAPAHGAASLLPWTTGNTWTYQVTSGSEVTTKIQTVGEQEPVGGSGASSEVLAFKAVSNRRDGTAETISWQAVDGDRIIRYREQRFSGSGELQDEEIFEPYRLRVSWAPEDVVVGASWIEEFQETVLEVGSPAKSSTLRRRWSVLAVDESVTVPAGTFSTVVVQRAGSSTTKTYWFAWGVGKVKETGGQTEELVSYEVAP